MFLTLTLGLGCGVHAPPAVTAPLSTPAPAPGRGARERGQRDGSPQPPETLDGQVVLVVNVASKCGFTPQYAGLQQLYEAHEDRGLVLVGVPCNQFGKQEPGSSEEIASFCSLNYGVDFPLLEKQDVNGPARSELYSFLIDSEVGAGAKVKWNFEKFLVGRDGQVLARFGSSTAPDDPALLEAIEAAL